MSLIIKDYEALKQESTRVESVDLAKSIIQRLEDTMKRHPNGYGLSAIQIGIPKRVAIIKYGRHEQDFIHLINPEFVEKGEEFDFYGEGCLSFPDIYMQTVRHRDFVIKNSVIDGDTFREETLYFDYPEGSDREDKLESIAIEHEMAHMDGQTLMDYGKPIVAAAPIIRENPKVGRNDPCPCGSGKKYKKCCLK